MSGSLNPLAGYLEKFKKFLTANVDHKQSVVSTVNARLGAAISEKDISVKGNEVRISGGSSLKSELFMHRRAITGDLQKNLNRSIVIR